MNRETIATTHSLQRSKERLDIKNVEYAERMIELAFQRGKRCADFHSKFEREFLSAKCSAGIEAVAFSGCCYIFNSESHVCITVYALPSQFGRKYMGNYKEQKLLNRFGFCEDDLYYDHSDDDEFYRAFTA